MAETQEKSATKGPTKKELRAKLQSLNEEYKDLAAEANAGNGAAQERRAQIAKELRGVSQLLHLREPDVEVIVPRSATGHFFRIGDLTFGPGRHTVKASTAQYLLWMIDKNRENEINRLRENGEQVDLGAIGEKATQIERSL